MRFTTDALVIREKRIGESDKLVTLLTREYGVISAFAPGAKSIKSKKAAATGLLSYSNFAITKKNDTYRINETSIIRIFFGAGSDVLKLSLAQYFCELALVLEPDSESSEEFLRIILNSLHFLVEDVKNIELIKAITELRIAAVSGYMPDLVACADCGAFESDIMNFKIGDGSILCDKCYSEVGAFRIDKTILSAMRHIVYSKFSSIYNFEIPENHAKILSDLTGRYIKVQTDHNFKTLDFYNSIK
ncbi:MAG: DNA repair protein RecO [Oscillospiraceae bacterium]|nr:DNA repair protein RecO [Oscillospiraceae bacterium]